MSASFMWLVPFVPSCTKTISASLSRRSPHTPLAIQRPRQRPVRSMTSVGTGSGAGVRTEAATTVAFFAGRIRRHHASFGATTAAEVGVDAEAGSDTEAGSEAEVGSEAGAAATTVAFFSCGISRPHHSSRSAVFISASLMLAVVGWLLAEKAR